MKCNSHGVTKTTPTFDGLLVTGPQDGSHLCCTSHQCSSFTAYHIHVRRDSDVFSLFKTDIEILALGQFKTGVVKRGAKVRLLRDNVVIHEGALKTLKRFKDEVREVKEGFECGMALENYQDIQKGDQIECFEIEEVSRELA